MGGVQDDSPLGKVQAWSSKAEDLIEAYTQVSQVGSLFYMRSAADQTYSLSALMSLRWLDSSSS